jgi:hypothetical protein
MSATSIPGLEFLNIMQETHVRATLEQTFPLLGHSGRKRNAEGVNADEIEPWPEDDGSATGRCRVPGDTSIKGPLLESGGLFMSYAAVSNIQYRLSRKGAP